MPLPPHRRAMRPYAVGLMVFVLSLGAFCVGIENTTKLCFDEFHYVPAARRIVAQEPQQVREHPPLAPRLISFGLQIFGDRPLGWRIASALFGALTLVGMFAVGMALFNDIVHSLWLCGMTAANQLLYVQSRIAMLDTFMVAFMVWALAAFVAVWRADVAPRTARRLLYACGALFGLSMACKWFAVVPLVWCVGAVGLLRLLQAWGTTLRAPVPTDWYQPNLLPGVRVGHVVCALVLLPLCVYASTFAFTGEGLGLNILQKQVSMYEAQLRVTQPHPYMSRWVGWAVMARPTWYTFSANDGETGFTRCVLLLGNPWVMWGGLAALLWCGWDFCCRRHRGAFLALYFFAALYASWSLIPRAVSFYYYYYPAGMWLSVAWAVAMREHPRLRWGALAVAMGLFVYFLPVLSAQPVADKAFQQYMWFRSWI